MKTIAYIALSTKSKHVALSGFNKAKYELHKYHAERYWGIFVARMLIWLYFLGVPWMPPVSFSKAIQHPDKVHTISIVAGQWFWKIKDEGFGYWSIGWRSRFSILSSSNSMDLPLIQMQVIPGFDNVFYYTFKKPGTYIIRRLECCG